MPTAMAKEPTKRAYTRGSCEKCRNRKKRCTQERPSCARCLKQNIPCVYSREFIEYKNGAKPRKETKFVAYQHEEPSKPTIAPPRPEPLSIQELLVSSHVLYLPTSEIDSSSSQIPIASDKVRAIPIFNDKAFLSDDFSVTDFLMSGCRADVAADADELNLGSNLALVIGNKVVKRKSQQCASSVDHIDLQIKPEELENVIYIHRPAITDDDKFTDLPGFIDKELADYLFRYFCDYSMAERSSFLRVCFPLIIGNILVLKCAFVLAFLQMEKAGDPQYPRYAHLRTSMDKLYLECLGELSERLKYMISVGCDHSLLCVYLVLSIETLTGCRTSVWMRTLKLGNSMISLRGGVAKLKERPTGACLCKMLAIFYTSGLTYDATNPQSVNFITADPEMLDCTVNGVEIFDNRNLFPEVPSKDFLAVAKMFMRISNLYSLLEISMKANVSNDFEKYRYVSSLNLNNVLSEGGALYDQLNRLEFAPSPYEQTLRFAKEAATLYLQQVIFRQISNSPGTIVLVKSMLSYVDEILAATTESRFVFTLPLLILGVDIVAPVDRKWYTEQLQKVHKWRNCEMIATVMMLLQHIWSLNRDGFSFIDWRKVCDEKCLHVSLVGL